MIPLKRLPWSIRAALLAAALCIGLALAAAPALAAPKARNPQECQVVASMAAMASVLAKHGYGEAEARKLYPDLFPLFYGQREDAGAMAQLAIAAAYRNRAAHPAEDPGVYAAALLIACQMFEGNLDAFLGTDS